MADTAAYFAGRRFGRHKLAPSISPGKTWEGVGGAMVGVLLYACVLGHAAVAGLPSVRSTASSPWQWAGDPRHTWRPVRIWIKRQAGVKDSGALLPGHGGLLDRIDALTSPCRLRPLAPPRSDKPMAAVQSLTILGSTGSIGTSTLDVVARHPDRFRVVALTANTQVDLLFEQCRRFQPRYAVAVDAHAAATLRQRVRDAGMIPRCCAVWRRWSRSHACPKWMR